MTEDTLAALRAHDAALRALLARLGTDEPGSAAFARAWGRSRCSDAEIEAWRGALAVASDRERAEGRALLESIVAVYAIAGAELAREREHIARFLAATRRARSLLGACARDDEVGESCDIAG